MTLALRIDAMPSRMPQDSRLAANPHRTTDDARAAIRRALREMGDVIRATRAPELGWLAPPRALWPAFEQDKRAIKDEIDAQAGKASKLEVRVIRTQPSPEAIDRAEALLERVRRFPKHQAIILVGFGCRIHMGKLAAHKEVRLSRRHAWRMLDGGCDVLAREGW